MKVGITVLGLHIAAIAAFALVQGCVTTESQGSGRGAGARHKGPWRHEHKGKAAGVQAAASDSLYQPGIEQDSVYDPVMIESTTSSSPEPQVTPAPSYENTEIYVVRKGDILSRLAVEFDTTTASLVAMNNLSNPDVLYVGQELRVPAGRRRKPAPAKTTRSIKKGETYVIRKGDTLSEIASAAGVSLADLRALNNIEGDRIIAGEKLFIPEGGKVPETRKVDPPEPEVAEPEPAPMAEPEVEPVETGSMELDAVMDHVVYPGETLDDLSRQYGVSKSDIMRMNNISDESAIKEGQRLRIPIAE